MPRRNSRPAIWASRALLATLIPIAPPPARTPVAGLDMDVAERLGQPHHHAGHAAVADDQVRADADRQHRHRRIELAQELRQILDARRPHQPFGRPAGAEPDEVGEAAVALGAALEPRQVDHARSCRRPRLGDAVGEAGRPFGDVAGAQADHHVARRGEVARAGGRPRRRRRPRARRDGRAASSPRPGPRHRPPRSAPRRPA